MCSSSIRGVKWCVFPPSFGSGSITSIIAPKTLYACKTFFFLRVASRFFPVERKGCLYRVDILAKVAVLLKPRHLPEVFEWFPLVPCYKRSYAGVSAKSSVRVYFASTLPHSVKPAGDLTGGIFRYFHRKLIPSIFTRVL